MMGMMFRGFAPPPSYGTPPTAAPLSPAMSVPSMGARDPAADSLAFNEGLANATVKRPGFFDQGGTGRMIAGVLGDAFSAASGGHAVFMPMLMKQQEADRQARQEALKLASDRSEWLWREDYKRAHPDDVFSQALSSAGIDPSSPEGRNLYRQRAESMAAPPLMAVDGFDAQGNPTKTFMPRTGFNASGGQPAPAGPAPGTVRNGYRFNGGDPNDRTSWVPVGGASPTGGATFR